LETPVSEIFQKFSERFPIVLTQKQGFLTQKQGFLTQKQEIISELISKLFSGNFCQFEKTGYFQKNSELQKPNYSETRENKKFRKFRLTQGLLSILELKWKQKNNIVLFYSLKNNKL